MHHAHKVENSTSEDIETILHLYELAREFQRSKKNVVVWPDFSPTVIERDIENGSQWKLVMDQSIACVWTTTRSDAAIWGPKNQDRALYIHRIATSPDFRGRNLVQQVTTWAQTYASEQAIDFVRLDTMGENQRLISLYQGAGFEYLGAFEVPDRSQLPDHYGQGMVQLFEIDLRPQQ